MKIARQVFFKHQPSNPKPMTLSYIFDRELMKIARQVFFKHQPSNPKPIGQTFLRSSWTA